MKSVVTVYKLLWNNQTFDSREEWFQDRSHGLTYTSSFLEEKAAEEAFHLTNAPIEDLTEEQHETLKEANFKGLPLSVGDVVRVEKYPASNTTPAEYYLCKSFGWEKFEGDVIQLIKHLWW